MAAHNELGKEGEEAASAYLSSKDTGYGTKTGASASWNWTSLPRKTEN